ncbi:MAG: RNA polymerase sigma factor RpoD/SigA [Bacteroidales bacterium]|nr:RNA polymerase sigma factor RpoD/SigA [Bacteroidales bacterium]
MQQLKITTSITKRGEGLDTYLAQISKIPMITPEEEVDLATRIRQGDEKAYQRLVEANLRFVVSVAKQYQNTGLALIDAIQDGNVGLMTAASKFDETRGFKFISYAVWWIRQSILQGMAENSRMVRLPLNQIGLLGKINKSVSKFEQENGRYPSEEEIADLIDFPAGKIREIQTVGSRHMSFDAPFEDDSDSSSLIDIIPNNNSPATDSGLDMESLSSDLNRALQVLKPRDREILILSFGLDGMGERGLEEIAERLDLTRERVRQIRERSIKQLRHTSAFVTLRQHM